MAKHYFKHVFLVFFSVISIGLLSLYFGSNVKAQPAPCGLFTDVPEGSTFYPAIHFLACHGIIEGYPDNTFRPGENVLRGQLSKLVSESAGFNEDPGAQIFTDVAPGHTFYDFINRLARRTIISGYNDSLHCGTQIPCFLPGDPASRQQIAKIVSEAKGYNDTIPTGQQTFADVLPGSTFYIYIERLAMHHIVTGYPCVADPNNPEHCDSQNRPYFRPAAMGSRGEIAKVVAETFFPGYQLTGTPANGTPSPTTSIDCPTHDSGDANCDTNIDLIDFEMWRFDSLDSRNASMRADFNHDNQVDSADFDIWKTGYTGAGGITPTATPPACRGVGEACTFGTQCCSHLCSAEGGHGGQCLPDPNDN